MSALESAVEQGRRGISDGGREYAVALQPGAARAAKADRGCLGRPGCTSAVKPRNGVPVPKGTRHVRRRVSAGCARSAHRLRSIKPAEQPPTPTRSSTTPSITLRLLFSAVLALAAATASAKPNVLLEFKCGIRADPLTAAGAVDVADTVRGNSPGGRAWVIRKLDAAGYSDAAVAVRGKGLLFASGDLIVTRGLAKHVAATLACGPADATATQFSSGPAELDAAGNFTIRGPLVDGAGNKVTFTETCAVRNR